MNSIGYIISIIFLALYFLKYNFVNLQDTESTFEIDEPIALASKNLYSYQKMRVFPGNILQRKYMKSRHGIDLTSEILKISNNNKYGKSIDLISDKIMKDGSKIVNIKQTSERTDIPKKNNILKKKFIVSIDNVSSVKEKSRPFIRTGRVIKKTIMTEKNQITINDFSKIEKHCSSKNSTAPTHRFFMFNSQLIGNVCYRLSVEEKKNFIKKFSYNNKFFYQIVPPMVTHYNIDQRQMKKIENVKQESKNEKIANDDENLPYNRQSVDINSQPLINISNTRNWDDIMN